jgi:large subunit ribosomal protein L25
MERLTIQAKKRTETGKNENNRLRSTGYVPINIIGNGKAKSAAVAEKEMSKILTAGVRPATLLNLNVEGEGSSLVFVKEVQRFPATNKLRHVDFYNVTPGKKIKTTVAIQTTGVAKGSKSGGQFEHLIHEIKIKSAPEDLKDSITVDVTHLEIGMNIKVSQLPVPKTWDILINGDPIVTSVNKTRAILAAERTDKPAETAPKAAAAAGAAKAGAPAAKKK